MNGYFFWTHVMAGFWPVIGFGFMILLPLGLLALAYAMWTKGPSIWRTGPTGSRGGSGPAGRRASHQDNRAFEAYRASELERIETEREKLQSVNFEFGRFRKRLRQAKDREEFDRFLAERG